MIKNGTKKKVNNMLRRIEEQNENQSVRGMEDTIISRLGKGKRYDDTFEKINNGYDNYYWNHSRIDRTNRRKIEPTKETYNKNLNDRNTLQQTTKLTDRNTRKKKRNQLIG